VRLERKHCGDCGFDLPLKQFATYRGVRHPLCRTCLAIDVAEFREYVLPFVLERRQLGVGHYARVEDWEWAVMERLELSGNEKTAMTLRPRIRKYAVLAEHNQRPEVLRPWKQLVGAQ
jgi:hypothetical protein